MTGFLCCVTTDSPSVAEEAEIFCMAEAIYFESRGESYMGQLAVGVKDHVAWTKALDFAKLILETQLEINGLENVTHYHSDKVSPKWSRKLHYKKTVGSHLFYVKKRSDM